MHAQQPANVQDARRELAQRFAHLGPVHALVRRHGAGRRALAGKTQKGTDQLRAGSAANVPQK